MEGKRRDEEHLPGVQDDFGRRRKPPEWVLNLAVIVRERGPSTVRS